MRAGLSTSGTATDRFTGKSREHVPREGLDEGLEGLEGLDEGLDEGESDG